MRSIINEKMYNTETATCVASYSNGNRDGADWDFDGVYEEIYIKKTGEWFIYGFGGEVTDYGNRDGNEWCSGEKIIPLADNTAKEWLAEHNFVDEYIKYFGEPTE